MREPFLRHADVPIEQARDGGLDLGEQRRVVTTGLQTTDFTA
ncbi:MAG: hypothetical protein ACRDF9_02260 [Candidatus Limnocylindria bacterium]